MNVKTVAPFDPRQWEAPNITDYRPLDKETAYQIIEMVSDGKSLTAACKELGIPYRSTVYRWLREHVEFQEMYQWAITCAGMSHGDNVAYLAAEAMKDLRVNGEINTEAAAIILKASPWLAEGLAPGVYNPKAQAAGPGPSVPKIEFSQADENLC
jgi:transposase-like protein